MTPHYGARPDDWTRWDLVFGLGTDLLPVVCTPNEPISPLSKLTSYGKVPSRFLSNGDVVGFPSWTSYVASNQDLDRWAAEPRYGICLQTRRVRALDCDVSDPALASMMQDYLRAWCHNRSLPEPSFRCRANSPKFLWLFELPGEYGKQTFQTESGIVEFLGNGQQCLIEGTHPSGVRYDWLPALEIIPVLTLDQWVELRHEFQRTFVVGEWSEPRLSTPRGETAAAGVIDDPVVDYLTVKGLVVSRSADGRVHVPCPWKDQHTTGEDPTATSYFPAGTNGYETPGFKCLHAHCVDKSAGHYLSAIGYLTDGFEVVPDSVMTESEDDVLRALGVYECLGVEAPPKVEHPLAVPRFLDRDQKTGAIYWTVPQVLLALERPDWLGLRVAWDDFTAKIMMEDVTGGGGLRPFTDTDYTTIARRLCLKGFRTKDYPIAMLRGAVHHVAESHRFDSALTWLNGVGAWDGTPRIDRFCEVYLGAEDTPYARAVSAYWWTAQAGRILDPGVQADMAIVLISGQGTGKTTAIRAIVPFIEWYAELSLGEGDANLSRAMMGKAIGELAELRGINGRDHEAVKAWVSRSREEWTPKYMETRRTYPRRLVLIGTSNQDEFLSDETGNRRWLPIHVGARQHRDAISRDRDQLWAEAAVRFRTEGVQWQEAKRLAIGEHQEFEIVDPWEATVTRWLTTPSPFQIGPLPSAREFLTSEDVLADALGLDSARVKISDKQRVGKILRRLGYEKFNKKEAQRVHKVWRRP